MRTRDVFSVGEEREGRWQGSGWFERDGRAQRKRRENVEDLPGNMAAMTSRVAETGSQRELIG